MKIKAHTLAVSVLALAALGASGGAFAQHGDSRSSGGGGGGHGGGHVAGSSGGRASHAGPAPSMRGGVGYRGPVTAQRSYSPASATRGSWGGGASARAPVDRRVYTPVNGRGQSGRPSGGYGYGHGYGRGYGYGYHLPYYSFVSVLPWYFGTTWWNGMPYYYADNSYYVYNDGAGQYQVVPPPGNAAPADSSVPPASEPYVYPNQGQNPEQQSSDRYECHRWAVDQTGFDPSRNDAGANAGAADATVDAYRRAEGACLEGRGYTVR